MTASRASRSVTAEVPPVHVYILIREDQSEHGYIDTSIVGIFRVKGAATEQERVERLRAEAEGLTMEDVGSEGEWQVSLRVEEHTLH